MVVGALEASRVLPFLRGRPDPSRAVVLRYHSVSDDTPECDGYRCPSIAVSPRTFRRQMRLLASLYTVVPLTTLVDRIVSGEPFAPRSVAITFDDGYMDNYRHALPILAQFALPATVYVTSGAVGNGWAFWPSRLRFALMRSSEREIRAGREVVRLDSPRARRASVARLTLAAKRLPVSARDAMIEEIMAATRTGADPPEASGWFMGWEELRAMHAAGIRIGAHTVTHPILTSQTDRVAADEIAMSRRTLEGGLGVTVDDFAYPNGGGVLNHDERVAALVRGAGFRSGSTSVEGPVRHGHDLFRLQRLGVNEATGVDGLALNLERDRLPRLPVAARTANQ